MCVSSHLCQLHYDYKSWHKTVHSQFYIIPTGFPSHYFVKHIQVISFTNIESADTSQNKNKTKNAQDFTDVFLALSVTTLLQR